MSDDNHDHPPDRLWWGVLCGAAGSLVTTILFVAFLAFGGHLRVTVPTLFFAGPHIGAAQIEPKGKLLFTLTGSNTIGSVLGPELVRSFLLHQHYGGVSIGPLAGSATHVDTVVQATDPGGAPVYVLLHAPGSKAAPGALAAGEADIGMMSTRMNFEDASQMPSDVAAQLKARFGDNPRQQMEHVIALDGVNVIVNSSNSLSDVSRSELAAIFSGGILDWKQVGRDPGAPISLIRRDDKSGTTETIMNLVMRPSGQEAFAPTARAETSSDAVVSFVGQTPGAIGFVGMGFAKGGVKALNVRDEPHGPALAPDETLIKLESYPLSRRLYLYAAPGKPLVDQFIQFAVSPAADEAVRTANFVNLDLERIDAGRAVALAHTLLDASPNAALYFGRIAGADRLSANLRFNDDQLDRRALADVDRLAAYVEAQHIDPSKLIFARVAGADEAGKDAAQRDVEAVRSALASAPSGPLAVTPEQFFTIAAPPPEPGAITPSHPGRHIEIWVKG
jgi:phosphate transport system substrate-binding protein